MPELPEVEHARRRLLVILGEGTPIVDAAALDPIVVPQTAAAWREAVVGRRIEGAERIGKNVVVRLSGDHALWFHLGMTGHVVPIARGASELPRFTRWWIETKHGRACLADGRRLGRSVAGARDEVQRLAKLDALGPDALSIPDAAALRARFARAKGPIKAALLDQSRIAGIGNIQAAEALWRAKIHPERPVPRLTTEQWTRLAAAIRASLEHALATMRDDEDVVYVEAGGPNPFQVYDREGEPCPRCGAKIAREVARGRSTYFCPRCQRSAGA
jgi:formamidopyrimidine-DNA glycosylase